MKLEIKIAIGFVVIVFVGVGFGLDYEHRLKHDRGILSDLHYKYIGRPRKERLIAESEKRYAETVQRPTSAAAAGISDSDMPFVIRNANICMEHYMAQAGVRDISQMPQRFADHCICTGREMLRLIRQGHFGPDAIRHPSRGILHDALWIAQGQCAPKWLHGR